MKPLPPFWGYVFKDQKDPDFSFTLNSTNLSFFIDFCFALYISYKKSFNFVWENQYISIYEKLFFSFIMQIIFK